MTCIVPRLNLMHFRLVKYICWLSKGHYSHKMFVLRFYLSPFITMLLGKYQLPTFWNDKSNRGHRSSWCPWSNVCTGNKYNKESWIYKMSRKKGFWLLLTFKNYLSRIMHRYIVHQRKLPTIRMVLDFSFISIKLQLYC